MLLLRSLRDAPRRGFGTTKRTNTLTACPAGLGQAACARDDANAVPLARHTRGAKLRIIVPRIGAGSEAANAVAVRSGVRAVPVEREADRSRSYRAQRRPTAHMRGAPEHVEPAPDNVPAHVVNARRPAEAGAAV